MSFDTSLHLLMMPAIVALLIKLYILLISRKITGQSSIFFTMVLIFACHNIAEVLGFVQYLTGEQQLLILRWYYVMSFCSLAAILLYSIDVSKILMPHKNISVFIVGLTSFFCILSLTTDLILAGSTSIGYIMTAVKGPYYWAFQVSALLTYAGIFCILIKGYIKAKQHITAIQCSYTLLAFAPKILVGVSLVILMALGVHLNAAAILPITTTLFLLITLKSEAKHKLTDIRRFVPFSIERKTSSEIMDIFSSYAKDETNYRDSMAEIEKLLVTHKHNKNGGNVSTTASSMEIPRSSLYSIFNRLDIEHNENEQ